MTIEEERAEQLAAIEEEIRGLTESPLYEYRTMNHYNPVIGEGRPTAGVVFIGEAPGEVEAKTGRPFVGPAGQVLDSMLANVGLARTSTSPTWSRIGRRTTATPASRRFNSTPPSSGDSLRSSSRA